MATPITTIAVALTGKDVGLQKTLTRSQKNMRAFGKSVGGLARGLGGLGGVAAGVAGALGARGVIRAADAYTNMQNRIKTVTSGTNELADVQDKLAQIAKRTGTNLTAAVEVFARIARNKEDIGRTNDELLKVIETLLKLGALGGSAPQEMKNALIQLSQGLASGTLRGEELNSVMEQMSPVARAIAEELRIPFGQLRKAAKDGLLTTEIVISAMERAAESADAEFAGLEFSVSSRFGVIGDQWTLLVGAISAARPSANNFLTQLLEGAAETLAVIRKNLDPTEFQRSILQAREATAAAGGIGRGAGFMQDFFASLEKQLQGPFGIFGNKDPFDTAVFERAEAAGTEVELQKILEVLNLQLDEQRIAAGKTAVARFTRT